MLKVVVNSFEPNSRGLFAKGDECYVRVSFQRPGMIARTHRAAYDGSTMAWAEALSFSHCEEKMLFTLVSSSRKAAKASVMPSKVVGLRRITMRDDDALVLGQLSVKFCRPGEQDEEVPPCPASIVIRCVDKITATLSASGQCAEIDNECYLRSSSIDFDVLELALRSDSRSYTFSIPTSTLQSKTYWWPMRCATTGSGLDIEASVRVIKDGDGLAEDKLQSSPISKNERHILCDGKSNNSNSHKLLDALPNMRTSPLRGILHVAATFETKLEETTLLVTFMNKTVAISSSKEAKIPFSWNQCNGQQSPWLIIHTDQGNSLANFPLDALLQLRGKAVVAIPSSSVRLVLNVPAKTTTESSRSGWIHASYWHVQMHRELDASTEAFRLNFSNCEHVLETRLDCEKSVTSPHGRRFDVPGCYSTHGQIRWSGEQAVDGVLIATTGQESGMWLRVDLQKAYKNDPEKFKDIGVSWIPFDAVTETPVDTRLSVYDFADNSALRIAELTMRIHRVPDNTMITKMALPASHCAKPDHFVFEAHFSSARYLHHPKCKGNLDAYVECSFSSSLRVSRGPIAFLGTKTHPSWQGGSMLLDLPLDVSTRIGNADRILPEIVDSVVLLVKVRSSTMKSTDDEIGRTSIGLASILCPQENDRWFGIFDSLGTEVGEICLAYARVVERHQPCQGGLVSVSIPKIDCDDSERREFGPRFVRVTNGDNKLKCFDLPKRLALPVPSKRGSNTLDLLAENSKTASAVTSLDLDSIIKKALAAAPKAVIREELQELDVVLRGCTAKVEAFYVPHSQGFLRLTPTHVKLDIPDDTLDDQHSEINSARRLFIRVATSGDHGRTKTSYCENAAWCKPSRRGGAEPVTLFVDTSRDFFPSPFLPNSLHPFESPVLQFSILDERPTWRNRVAVGSVPLLPLLTPFSEFSFDLFDSVTRALRGRASVKTEYVRLCVDIEPELSRCAALAVLKRTLSDVSSKADPMVFAKETGHVRSALLDLCPDNKHDELIDLVDHVGKIYPDQTRFYAWREVLTTAVICPNVHVVKCLLPASHIHRWPGVKTRLRKASGGVAVSFTINFSGLPSSTLQEVDAIECVKRSVVELLPDVSRFKLTGAKIKCFAFTRSSVEARGFVKDLKKARNELQGRLSMSFGETQLSDLSVVLQKKKALRVRVKTRNNEVIRREEAQSTTWKSDIRLHNARDTRRKLRIDITTAHAVSAALISKQNRRKRMTESNDVDIYHHYTFVERRKVRKLVRMIQESRDAARLEAQVAREDLEAVEEKLRLAERPLCAAEVREGAALEAARQERRIKSLQTEVNEFKAELTASRNQTREASAKKDSVKFDVEKAVALRHVVESRESELLLELERRMSRDVAVGAHQLSRAAAQETRLECARRARAEYEEDERRRERAAVRIQQHLLRPRIARQITKRTRKDNSAVYRGVLACVRLRRKRRQQRRLTAAIVRLQAIARARMARKRREETGRRAGFVASKWRAWRRSRQDSTFMEDDNVQAIEERQIDFLDMSRARRRVRQDRKEAALAAYRAALSTLSTEHDLSASDEIERIKKRKERALVLILYVFVRAVRRRLAAAHAHWRRRVVKYDTDRDEIARRVSRAVERGLEEAAENENYCRELVVAIVAKALDSGEENESKFFDRFANEIVSNRLNTIMFEDCDDEVEEVASSAYLVEMKSGTASNWSSPGEEDLSVFYDRIANEIVSNRLNTIMFEDCDKEVEEVASSGDLVEMKSGTASNWSSPGEENPSVFYDRIANEIVSNRLNTIMFEDCDKEVEEVASSGDLVETRSATVSNWSSPTVYSPRCSSPDLFICEEGSSSSYY